MKRIVAGVFLGVLCSNNSHAASVPGEIQGCESATIFVTLLLNLGSVEGDQSKDG